MGAERCVACGAIIPEGQQLCHDCMNDLEIEPQEAAETAAELRDIADVLSITANTDGNIRRSMEALLRIADRLSRRKRDHENK